jgi:hypothetical protein
MSKTRPAFSAEIRPLTTASTMSPSTSSMTAAPRMMRPSTLAVRLRSPSTRAVMPTLVAVSVAPTNQWTSGFWPWRKAIETPKPNTMGVITPRTATSVAESPTAAILPTSDSSPT